MLHHCSQLTARRLGQQVTGLLTGLCLSINASAQINPTQERDLGIRNQQELQRQQQQEQQQRQQLERATDVRLTAPEREATQTLPIETPCILIERIQLQDGTGASPPEFDWVFEQLTAPNAPVFIGQCVGAQGVTWLIERTQKILLDRGFVTSQVLAPQQDMSQGTLLAAASTVGSVGGNVTITAGNQYKQVGSDVLTPKGDINITAKTVDIVEARETNKQSTEQKFEQSGLTLSLSSPLLTAVQTAQAMSKAASQTSDTRMKALAGASAALAASQAAAAVSTGQGDANGQLKNADGSTVDANAADKAGGISIAISLGSSKSSSQQTSQTDTARGSSVNAEG